MRCSQAFAKVTLALVAAAAIAFGQTAQAAPIDVWWDTNGATPGSGNAGGLWSSANWSTDSTGSSATAVWMGGSGNSPHFSAGADGTGTWTVDPTVAGRTITSLYVEEGNVTLASTTGGAMSVFSGQPAATWATASGTSLAVNVDTALNSVPVTFDVTGPMSFSGNIATYSSATSLIKTGTGTLTFAGSGTSIVGTSTTVNAGTLLVNETWLDAPRYSSIAIRVNGGVFGGAGTISDGTPVVVNAGTLAPGAASGAAGTLTLAGGTGLSGSLTLNSDSILAFDLNGGNIAVGGGINDLFTGARGLTLDGTLNVSALASFATANVGDTWRLINYTGTLTDNGLLLGTMPTLGTGKSFAIDNSIAGQVNLMITAVPEPSVFILLASGLLGLLAYAWRRQK